MASGGFATSSRPPTSVARSDLLHISICYSHVGLEIEEKIFYPAASDMRTAEWGADLEVLEEDVMHNEELGTRMEGMKMQLLAADSRR